MTETLFNVFKILAMFLALGGFTIGGYYLIYLLKRLADKYNAEKISARIFDAMEKMKMVLHILAGNAFQTLSKESQEALSDGIVTNDEVIGIVSSVSVEAIETLKTEIPTITKYFLGGSVEKFIKQLIGKYLIDYAKSKLGFKNMPLTK